MHVSLEDGVCETVAIGHKEVAVGHFSTVPVDAQAAKQRCDSFLHAEGLELDANNTVGDHGPSLGLTVDVEMGELAEDVELLEEEMEPCLVGPELEFAFQVVDLCAPWRVIFEAAAAAASGSEDIKDHVPTQEAAADEHMTEAVQPPVPSEAQLTPAPSSSIELQPSPFQVATAAYSSLLRPSPSSNALVDSSGEPLLSPAPSWLGSVGNPQPWARPPLSPAASMELRKQRSLSRSLVGFSNLGQLADGNNNGAAMEGPAVSGGYGDWSWLTLPSQRSVGNCVGSGGPILQPVSSDGDGVYSALQTLTSEETVQAIRSVLPGYDPSMWECCSDGGSSAASDCEPDVLVMAPGHHHQHNTKDNRGGGGASNSVSSMMLDKAHEEHEHDSSPPTSTPSSGSPAGSPNSQDRHHHHHSAKASAPVGGVSGDAGSCSDDLHLRNEHDHDHSHRDGAVGGDRAADAGAAAAGSGLDVPWFGMLHSGGAAIRPLAQAAATSNRLRVSSPFTSSAAAAPVLSDLHIALSSFEQQQQHHSQQQQAQPLAGEEHHACLDEQCTGVISQAPSLHMHSLLEEISSGSPLSGTSPSPSSASPARDACARLWAGSSSAGGPANAAGASASPAASGSPGYTFGSPIAYASSGPVAMPLLGAVTPSAPVPVPTAFAAAAGSGAGTSAGAAGIDINRRTGGAAGHHHHLLMQQLMGRSPLSNAGGSGGSSTTAGLMGRSESADSADVFLAGMSPETDRDTRTAPPAAMMMMPSTSPLSASASARIPASVPGAGAAGANGGSVVDDGSADSPFLIRSAGWRWRTNGSLPDTLAGCSPPPSSALGVAAAAAVTTGDSGPSPDPATGMATATAERSSSGGSASAKSDTYISPVPAHRAHVHSQPLAIPSSSYAAGGAGAGAAGAGAGVSIARSPTRSSSGGGGAHGAGAGAGGLSALLDARLARSAAQQLSLGSLQASSVQAQLALSGLGGSSPPAALAAAAGVAATAAAALGNSMVESAAAALSLSRSPSAGSGFGSTGFVTGSFSPSSSLGAAASGGGRHTGLTHVPPPALVAGVGASVEVPWLLPCNRALPRACGLQTAMTAVPVVAAGGLSSSFSALSSGSGSGSGRQCGAEMAAAAGGGSGSGSAGRPSASASALAAAAASRLTMPALLTTDST